MMVARYLPALMEVKPAVTLAVGGSLVGVHFRLLGTLPFLYGQTIQDVCLMPGAILCKHQASNCLWFLDLF